MNIGKGKKTGKRKHEPKQTMTKARPKSKESVLPQSTTYIGCSPDCKYLSRGAGGWWGRRSKALAIWFACLGSGEVCITINMSPPPLWLQWHRARNGVVSTQRISVRSGKR